VTVSQIVADSRTNQLIVVASPRSYEAIREMAEALDVPIAGEGQIHVLFLENANATELASTLQGLTQSVEQAREDEGRGRRQDRDRDEDAAPAGPATVSATFTGDVSITADEPTNSLLVVASLRDFLNLERVVEQLDRRREQVYVEAVIMEVNVDNTGQMGLAFNAGAIFDIAGEEVPLIFGTSLGSLNSLVLDPTALQGLAMALRGPELEGTEGLLFPGIGIPSFGAILQAVQTDTSVNIMATPHILTTDNEEAEIIVGQTIPYIVGGTIGAGSAFANLAGSTDIGEAAASVPLGTLGLPTFNVQREQVSLTLRIKPQINESNFVRLEIL
jgi:general secretion pathway protein D